MSWTNVTTGSSVCCRPNKLVSLFSLSFCPSVDRIARDEVLSDVGVYIVTRRDHSCLGGQSALKFGRALAGIKDRFSRFELVCVCVCVCVLLARTCLDVVKCNLDWRVCVCVCVWEYVYILTYLHIDLDEYIRTSYILGYACMQVSV